MRFSVSILGVVGVILTVASIFMVWVVVEHSGSSEEYLLTQFDHQLGADPSNITIFAYSTALYLMIVGMVISVSSLLGGFVTLAGVGTFAIGGFVGNSPNLSFGSDGAYQTSTYPGIGFYLAVIAATVMIVSMIYPLEVGFGTGGKRPRFRTWHICSTSKSNISTKASASDQTAHTK